jgi:CMP/dCMP kinase
MKRKLIIALDGPAGSGKSTTAKALAQAMGLPYIDTGAMYRSATLKAMRLGVDLKNTKALVKTAKSVKISFKESRKKQRVFLDGKDVTKAIRLPELTKNVFYVAQEPLIRREMVKKQRALGKKNGGVMEGRDIGTVVFPNADYKFFLDADPKIRAKRRYKELVAVGKKISYKEVLRDLIVRDGTDLNRKEGPLRLANDAIKIDTTSLTIPETVDKILQVIKKSGA